MVAKRIIPCLDVMNGATVKGVNFLGLKEVGDPVELGRLYSEEGADELVYLDISATNEGRTTFKKLVSRIAQQLSIPFTVGGGISSLENAAELFQAGADKISINSSAVYRPELISEIANRFGKQAVVVAIDARYTSGDDRQTCGDERYTCANGRWIVTTHGGKKDTEKELFSWAKEVERRGAGEILFTSMNHDGTKNGYACDTYKELSELVSIPIIASGGAGKMEDIKDVLEEGVADAALAASIFHYREIGIGELKEYLNRNNIKIRL